MSRLVDHLLKMCGYITLVEHEQKIDSKNREIVELKKDLFMKKAELYVAEAEVERFQYICGKHRMSMNNQDKQLRLAEEVLKTFSLESRRL